MCAEIYANKTAGSRFGLHERLALSRNFSSLWLTVAYQVLGILFKIHHDSIRTPYPAAQTSVTAERHMLCSVSVPSLSLYASLRPDCRGR
jgi:hypothetical protein